MKNYYGPKTEIFMIRLWTGFSQVYEKNPGSGPVR